MFRRLGVTLPGGGKLPSPSINASLVRGLHRYFLAYCAANYEAILDYNCSNSYAVSVGVMADADEESPGTSSEPEIRKGQSKSR